jgi:hypothetical protein
MASARSSGSGAPSCAALGGQCPVSGEGACPSAVSPQPGRVGPSRAPPLPAGRVGGASRASPPAENVRPLQARRGRGRQCGGGAATPAPRLGARPRRDRGPGGTLGGEDKPASVAGARNAAAAPRARGTARGARTRSRARRGARRLASQRSRRGRACAAPPRSRAPAATRAGRFAQRPCTVRGRRCVVLRDRNRALARLAGGSLGGASHRPPGQGTRCVQLVREWGRDVSS